GNKSYCRNRGRPVCRPRSGSRRSAVARRSSANQRSGGHAGPSLPQTQSQTGLGRDRKTKDKERKVETERRWRGRRPSQTSIYFPLLAAPLIEVSGRAKTTSVDAASGILLANSGHKNGTSPLRSDPIPGGMATHCWPLT